MDCPCCSGKLYSDCCHPLHLGEKAPTALALMRSRYSAYALKRSNYIIKTTHPKSPYFEPNQTKWKRAILEFCESTQFEKLEIIAFSETSVHFIAHLRQNGKALLLEEKSSFEKVDNRWFYLSADYPKQ